MSQIETLEASHKLKEVGIIFDEIFLEHKPFYSHPENPSRLTAIVQTLEFGKLWDKFSHLELGEPAIHETKELLRKIHSHEHIEMVEGLAGHYGNIDSDTYYSPDTSSVALRAAYASWKAVETVMSGKLKKIFVLARPPGHHATISEAMGFCIYNNAAVAAEKAKEMGAERILIVDFDIHHGNGTQEIFYSRDDVLYFSTHRYPFYPGTGKFDEIGEGKGKGFNINIPLPSGLSDGEYKKIYEEIFSEISRKFDPHIVIVSAGFDAHYKDPLGDMNLTEEGFAMITDIILRSAPRARGFVFILEGGYSLDGLSSSVREVLLTMADIKNPDVTTSSTHTVDKILLDSQKYFSMWLSN